MVELVEEFLLWHLVEGLTKVADGYVDLLPSVEGLEEVMSSHRRSLIEIRDLGESVYCGVESGT